MSPRHFLHDAARPPLSSQVEAAECSDSGCTNVIVSPQRFFLPLETSVWKPVPIVVEEVMG